MLIFSKYKESAYFNLDDIFDMSKTVKANLNQIKYLFKYSKKLIRSLLLVFFYVYSFLPFCPVLFRGSARFFLKLDSNLLVITDPDCLDNYSRF